jgi:hypothetical protein
MKLHTEQQLGEYCNNLEENKRYGAKFFREAFNVVSKSEALEIPREDQ